jgi:molecular chaperone Hsp33
MDYLIRGMARNDKVRIIGCDCKETIDLICKKHETYPIATIALGRFLCASLMMGAMNKENQTVTLTINGGGELGTLFAQSNSKGDVRGFVSNAQVDLPLVEGKWDIEGAVGNDGLLTVIKSFDEKNNFTSQVKLAYGDISSDFAVYFFESEQLPTIVNLGVELDKEGNVSNAKGYIIQLMTGYEESDVEYLEKLSLASLDKNIDDVVLSMFSDFKKLENTKVSFACDCGKEKFEKGLRSLKREDLEEILNDQGYIETMCNFCSEKYVFSREEVEKILESYNK